MYDFKRVDYGGKYPKFEKYENLTAGTLSALICEWSLKGHSDNEIAILLGVRWAYLFSGLRFDDWADMVSEYRQLQKNEAGESVPCFGG